MTFILILMMHVGPMGDGNSNALTIAEFSSAKKCNDAGDLAKLMAKGTVKKIEFVCVEK